MPVFVSQPSDVAPQRFGSESTETSATKVGTSDQRPSRSELTNFRCMALLATQPERSAGFGEGTAFLALLGAAVDDGIPAADVGENGVGDTDTVLYRDFMTITGAAAISVVFALGQECGEDAVLHVEEGHVLM